MLLITTPVMSPVTTTCIPHLTELWILGNILQHSLYIGSI